MTRLNRQVDDMFVPEARSPSSGRPMSIGEMTKAYDVTPRALRFYEGKGLLSPRRKGTERVYEAGDQHRLEQILEGKRLGFSLSEIGEMIAKDGISEDRSLSLGAERIDRQIKHLLVQRDEVDLALRILKRMQRQVASGLH